MYDDGGRLIRSVTTVEPEWDVEQRSLLLASVRLEADIGPHGQPMSEATSPDADPARPGGWSYRANKLPIIDRAARELDHARADYEKRYPNADTAGHVWRVERVES